MEAIRKIQTVKNGQVCMQLPEKFWGQKVEIIVLSVPNLEARKVPKKSRLGCLHQYANPSLIPREHEAWQDAMKVKHGPC